MSDIFISYSSKDRKTTRSLVKVFEQHGWTVWWDKYITPGKAFDRAISQALDTAKCIIVLWSKNSVKSDWVMEEALEGTERKILIPARIDTVGLPFGFRRIQTINLSRWKGSDSSSSIKQLINAVENLVEPARVSKPNKPAKKAIARKRPRKLTGALDGKTIVFTGTLSENRAAHVEKVNTVGARYIDSVSGKTDYLVVGKEPGAAKLRAAEKHGVKKLSERQWLKILNESYARILAGKTIVFTGKLSQPRSKLEAIARKLGAKPVVSVSGNTSYLIVGEEAGEKKLSNAKKHNVEIITEAVWNDIVSTLKS
ncbi:TIR domain-containing protein [Draconibacterium sp.]|nr:TIR domain-containing protein [Draconibacterium sp.]